jgi:YD repeat-containing protein
VDFHRQFHCSNTVKVIFYVIQAGGENNGEADCNSIVAQPINVTNGNMYLQHMDYMLPGAGHMIHLERTYNSNSTQIGLFGRGWSTAYDESLTLFDSSVVRLNAPDGRGIYFGRPPGSSGAFLSLVGDFHGQITQTAGGYNLSLKDGTLHQFNSTGRLNGFIDRNGNQTTLQYNVSGKLSSVTDAFGRVLSFFLNPNGRVVAIADTTGILAEYTYGTNSEMLSVTYQDNSGYTFTYDSNLRLATASDKLNNLLESHTYDSQGRAITSQKHGGVESYTLNYVSATETQVTDGLGRVTKYFFDTSKGRNVVTRIEGLCGCGGGGTQVLTWTYDNSLNVTQTTDGLGHPTDYTYDSIGNVLTVSDATAAEVLDGPRSRCGQREYRPQLRVQHI